MLPKLVINFYCNGCHKTTPWTIINEEINDQGIHILTIRCQGTGCMKTMRWFLDQASYNRLKELMQ